jgi:hypothetical protein
MVTGDNTIVIHSDIHICMTYMCTQSLQYGCTIRASFAAVTPSLCKHLDTDNSYDYI